MSTPTHVPVMLDRVVALLAPAVDRPGATFLDATLGLGGHTEAVLERCPDARVIGVDRDQHALDLAGDRLAAHRERLTLVHAVYDEIPSVLDELGLRSVDGILFDLGLQLEALWLPWLVYGLTGLALAALFSRLELLASGVERPLGQAASQPGS